MADTLLGGIVINEVLVNPTGTPGFDTDGNGSVSAIDEYVEIYNASNLPIDISGLELWDAGIGNWFTFPPGTVLQPGAHAMVMSGVQAGGALPTGDPGDLFFDAGRSSAVINNGGDNVVLYDPTNDEFIQGTFSGDALDDPTVSYSGFSATATRVGAGEDFGNHSNGVSLQRYGDGNDTWFSGGPTPGTDNVCFAAETRITTNFGTKPAGDIEPGDHIMTPDNGFQAVVWCYAKSWSADDIAMCPKLRPVKVDTGALGHGLPLAPLRVSRQHRLLVQGPIAQRMFGHKEVLVPAVALVGLPGIDIDTSNAPISYVHIMCAQHEVIFAEGAPTETLFLGREAVSAIAPDAFADLAHVLDLSPSALLAQANDQRAARPLAKGERARRLAQRHAKNRKALVFEPEHMAV